MPRGKNKNERVCATTEWGTRNQKVYRRVTTVCGGWCGCLPSRGFLKQKPNKVPLSAAVTYGASMQHSRHEPVFVSFLLDQIFSLVCQETWRRLYNEDEIKEDNTGGSCSTHEMRNIYNILFGKPEGKWSFGWPGRRWEDNIRTVLREIERKLWAGFICLRTGPVANREHENEGSVSIKGGKFLD
jgi:hypothetical protein